MCRLTVLLELDSRPTPPIAPKVRGHAFEAAWAPAAYRDACEPRRPPARAVGNWLDFWREGVEAFESEKRGVPNERAVGNWYESLEDVVVEAPIEALRPSVPT